MKRLLQNCKFLQNLITLLLLIKNPLIPGNKKNILFWHQNRNIRNRKMKTFVLYFLISFCKKNVLTYEEKRWKRRSSWTLNSGLIVFKCTLNNAEGFETKYKKEKKKEKRWNIEQAKEADKINFLTKKVPHKRERGFQCCKRGEWKFRTKPPLILPTRTVTQGLHLHLKTTSNLDC